MKKAFVTLFQGLALGTAEIIPGVSGSTVALLFGIYDDFIELLYSASELVKVMALFVLKQKKWRDVKKTFLAIRWQFGILLGGGMLAAIIGLSSVIALALANIPWYLFSFLFGLTPPTLYIVYKEIHRPSWSKWGITGVTALGLFIIFQLAGSTTAVTNPHPLHLFFGGLISISVMVLPGVSGSFMLLVLGLYSFVIGLISKLTQGGISSPEVIQLGSLLAGIGTGFITTVRLLKYAFGHWRDQLMSFILGLLISSWYVLYPFVRVVGEEHGEPILGKVSPMAFDTPTQIGIVLTSTITAILVWKLHSWADKRDAPVDSGFDKL